ncbi:MAG: carbohydrate porin [Betaproteobacteria bacterium]|nr:carbohydrate porin [Betaproteobacteria bacterium]
MRNIPSELNHILVGFTLSLILALPVVTYAENIPEENWNVKFQATYIWQKKPSFNAAYSGPNSLLASKEKSYTFTSDAFLGVRVRQGSELYFVPEITQGVPFSNLTGMGGFTNGEITRVSGTNPTIYRQQLFLRQTWGLGGDTEKIESGMNQLAGVVEKNRFVLTAGNFSTLNIFDNNTYAHDPRTQFMNWSNMTYAAYDYAADARGFGWGFAGEWYQDDWVLRFGRMTGPREPNQLPLDFRFFKHYGDQLEIEHSHELGGQPGKVRLLGWRNRAVLASYRDAINLGLVTGTIPNIFKVRYNEKVKYGLGVNIEQAIKANVGVFLRAMQTDGRTETLAFTEVDQSVAGGISLKGASWGRELDTVGVALIGNALSRDRRDYLQAGGISFFIGDGALHYRPETILESYYNWNVAKHAWFTADYQHIANPAYNTDRGPVDVFGVRLHLE